MNAAALLFVAGKSESLVKGVALARESIRSGQALTELQGYINATM